jgi:hypothetical protein
LTRAPNVVAFCSIVARQHPPVGPGPRGLGPAASPLMLAKTEAGL